MRPYITFNTAVGCLKEKNKQTSKHINKNENENE